MRRATLSILFFLILLAAGWVIKYHPDLSFDKILYQSPCDTPQTFRIDYVDPRFKVSVNQFKKDSEQAADIWSQAYGKNLFKFDPEGKLSINLQFDERQQLNNQITSLQNQVENQKSALDPQIVRFNQEVADFKKKVADLNSQIAYWNSHGGAPPDTYNQLIKAQQDLKSQADQLNAEARRLNQSAQDFNANVGSLNQTIGTFNAVIEGKPEEGIFDPNTDKIVIYFDTNKNELIHTLAHELGHALSLNHVQEPKSIMYALSNQIISPSDQDRSELQLACRKKSLLEILSLKLNELYNSYRQQH